MLKDVTTEDNYSSFSKWHNNHVLNQMGTLLSNKKTMGRLQTKL